MIRNHHTDDRGSFKTRMAWGALTLAATALLATGCASQDTVDKGRNSIHALQKENLQLEQDRDSWKAQAERANQQSLDYIQDLNDRDSTILAIKNALGQAQRDNNEFIQELDALNPAMLPHDVDEALEEVAASHPELLSYDSKRGMIRLASDLTFDLGSDSVRDEAASALREVAAILGDGDLGAFDIRIVGHTDSVPIGRPATRAKHPTNLHLSVHRAISVENILKDAGLDPLRMAVMGWGAYRPIVENDPKKGAAENRRVEIYLVASTLGVDSLVPANDSTGEEGDAGSGVPIGPAGSNDDNEPMK